MNLHAIVGPIISAVNPSMAITLQASTGYVTNADGSRTPSYAAPVSVLAQVQPETWRDIQQMDGLNLQGTRKSMYISGYTEGLQRLTVQGGDLVTLPDGTIWLVAQISSRIPTLRIVVFVLSFLAVYDWLTLTGRLYHRACLLLAFGAAVAFGRWFGRHQDQAARFFRKATPWALAAVAVAFVAIQGGKWWHESSAVAALPSAAPGAPNVLVIVIGDRGSW